MRVALVALALVGLCLAAPAEAQNRRASGEVGIFGGYRVFDADIDDDFSFGAHIGLNITDNAEIEARYTRVDTEAGGSVVDVDLTSYSLGFTWNHHPEGRLSSPKVPYFTVGVGRTDLGDPIVVGSDGTARPVIDEFDYFFLGGGFRYFWGESFGVRLDVRAFLWGDDGDFGETDELDWQTSVGLTWVFGG